MLLTRNVNTGTALFNFVPKALRRYSLLSLFASSHLSSELNIQRAEPEPNQYPRLSSTSNAVFTYEFSIKSGVSHFYQVLRH